MNNINPTDFTGKIAVATNDRIKITGHIGRCKGFNIFEIIGSKIINTEYRANNFTNHQGHGNHGHHEHEGHGHSHTRLIEALKDCTCLISKGGGWRVVEDLKQHGISPIFTDAESVDDAVNKFITGELVNNPELTCRHD